MITVTAKEAKNRLGEILSESMREPVEITHHGRPYAYVLSKQAFERVMHGNAQARLDRFRDLLACEIVAKFSLDEIRRQSLQNLARWKENGVDSLVYGEWQEILAGDDVMLLRAMLSSDDTSRRLRQSPPYVGVLDKEHVEALREKSSS